MNLRLDFESKLRALFGEYGFSLQNVINLLDPQVAAPLVLLPHRRQP
ncbi:hypothetical protein PG5_44720 [Pseudomonas sp. G5(2012)]|nr:hypothetical protein PG5_44720 [Pseudomonas sp. G5(2012)]